LAKRAAVPGRERPPASPQAAGKEHRTKSRKRKLSSVALEKALSHALVSVGRTVQRAASVVGRTLPARPAGRPKPSRGRAPGRRPGTTEPHRTPGRWRPTAVSDVAIRGPVGPRDAELLTADALAFVAELHRRFGARARDQASDDEPRRQVSGELKDRYAEITGRDAVLVDLQAQESSNWTQVIEAHLQIRDGSTTGFVIVRPRRLHAVEEHLAVDKQPISAALFDVGLWAFHGAAAQRAGLHCDLSNGESEREARLWNDLFQFMEQSLGLAAGAIKIAVTPLAQT
jgi:malate synthase